MMRISGFLLFLLAFCLCPTTKIYADATKKLYAVIFEVRVDAKGIHLNVNKVFDAYSGSKEAVSINVPDQFVVAVMKELVRKNYPTSEKPFYTYFFYDPDQPARADIDPKKESSVDEGKKFEEFCKTASCRKNFKIHMTLKDGSKVDRVYPLLPPVVGPSLISLYLGEMVYIEADETETGPTNFALVDKITKPEKTIILDFQQSEVPTQGLSMLLTIKNPYSKSLRYDVHFTRLDHQESIKTSTCPIKAGQVGHEVWRDPIMYLVIDNIHFLGEGESDSCGEGNIVYPPAHEGSRGGGHTG